MAAELPLLQMTGWQPGNALNTAWYGMKTRMANPSDLLAPCAFKRRSDVTTFSIVMCLFGGPCMLSMNIHPVICISVMGVARDA